MVVLETLKKYWYIVLLVLATIFFVVIKILTAGKANVSTDAFKEAVRVADTDATIEKTKVKVQADVKRQELDEIKKMENEDERRKRLSEFLNKLDA